MTVTGWPLYHQKVSFSADPALPTSSHLPSIQEDGTWSLQTPPRTTSIPDLASDAYSLAAGGPSSPLCVSGSPGALLIFPLSSPPTPEPSPVPFTGPCPFPGGQGVGGKPAPQEPAPPDNVLLWATAPLALRAPWSLGLGWGDDK